MAINKGIVGIGDAGGFVPSDNFNTVLYTGNGGTQSVTGVGFKPDLVWVKARQASVSNILIDSVRGVSRQLASNSNEQEYFNSGKQTTAFNSDGFTVVDQTNGGFGVNGAPGQTFSGTNAYYVSWNWKAGGAAVSNTDGTIASEVSVNTEAGFSIVSFTSNGAGSPVSTGHGLSSVPELVIFKNRDDTSQWPVFHKDIGFNGRLQLEDSASVSTFTPFFDITTTTIAIRQSSLAINGNKCIAYCFHSVDGYSKIGSYTASGTSDFDINVGFRPRFLLIKSTTSSQPWAMSDSIRNPGTPPYAAYRNLYANLNNSEGVASPPATNSYVEYRATGFGFTAAMISAGTNPAYWSNGNTYMYLAIA